MSKPIVEKKTDSGQDVNSEQGCMRWRYLTAILAFFAMFSSYSMRGNISVAIVDMVVSSNSSASSDQCGDDLHAEPVVKSGEFDWSKSTQGLVLSSFYWGYVVPQIAAGRLADRYGPRYVVLVGGLLGTLMTFLGPVAAKVHVAFLIATRVICGLSLGVFYPCVHALIARWAIRSQRSFYVSFALSGMSFGTVVSMAVSGVLCSSKADWEWTFYLFGITSSIWLICWALFVYDSPKAHPWISHKERIGIERSLKEAVNFEKSPPVPWRKLLTSKGIWAIIIVFFGNGWAYYTMLTELPTYMNDTLGFDMEDNGLYSAIPYLVAMVVGNISGFVADIILRRKYLKALTTRRMFTGLGLFISGGCLLIVPFIDCQPMVTYGILVISIGFNNVVYGGFTLNAIDLVPNFAGTIIGISNTFGTIPGIVSPYLTGAITDVKPEDLFDAWAIVFYIAFGVVYFTCIIYLIFAEANLLPWNDLSTEVVFSDRDTSPSDNIFIDGGLSKMSGNDNNLKLKETF